MDQKTHCESLAARFEKMSRNGMRNVKFYLRESDEATPEAVCAEFEELFAAVDRGEDTPLTFDDAIKS